MIQIKNQYTHGVIFESKTATTIKEAVEEAVKKNADLFNADLSNADLSNVNLFNANLLFCKMDKKVLKQITKKWFKWKVKL